MNVYHVNKTITSFGDYMRGIGQSFLWTMRGMAGMGFRNFLVDLSSKNDNYKRMLLEEGLHGFEYINQYWDDDEIDYLEDIRTGDKVSVLDHSFDKGIIHVWDNVPFRSDKKQILTIHDTFLFDPKYMWMRKAENGLKNVPEVISWIKRASAIVCPSEFSKNDVLELIGKYGGIMRVIGWGSKYQGANFLRASLPNELKLKPFFLYVSCAEKRKNFNQLAEAFDKMDDPSITLVIVSDPSLLSEEESEYLYKFKMRKNNVILYRNLRDDVLGVLMQEALAVIVTSTHEGFGMPVVEAASLRTRAIVRETTSMKEFKDFATYYDGTVDGLVDVMQHHKFNKKLELRFDSSRKYNYHKAASEYGMLYKEINNGN